MKKKDNYPVLPHISYGKVIDRDGFYFSFPFKGISLNEYKKMHFSKIARLKGQYKSMFDVMCSDCLDHKHINFADFDADGLKINKNLFRTQVDVEWVLNFLHPNNRDTANYTQKIMLDALVKVGMLPDDREKFVKSDKTFFGMERFDMVTCILQSDCINHDMVVGGTPQNYDDIMKRLGVNKDRIVIFQEDDGGYDE